MIQELLGGGSATPTRLLGERTYSNSLFSSTCPSTPLLTTNTSISSTPPSYTTTSTALANSANTSTGTGGGANNNSNSNSNNNNNNNNSNSNNNNNNNVETNGNSNSQNLRCPRCDSTNTKFCYYNNYNLTQPRHFCKTCRRYWTKGGTLRNVPIGGGCRKNKSTISSNNSPSSSMSTKSSTIPNNFMVKCNKATFSSDMLLNDHNNSLFLGNGLLDHSLQSSGPSPLLWSSPPQSHNSHILALLRGSSASFSNPNPNPNHGSSVFTTLGLDSYSNGAPSLLGSFTRSNQHHLLNGFAPDFVDNNGPNNNNGGAGGGGSNIMDLYQRLKSSNSSSTNYGYCSGNENSGPTILGHLGGSSSSPSSSSSMNSTLFETTPLGGGGGGDHLGGYGFMMSTTPAFSSWSEFPAVPINGAYP